MSLPPEHAGGPYSLSIRGDGSEISLSDILIGDVYLASGQSNMEFPLEGFAGAPLRDGPAEIASASQPMIRLLQVKHRSSDLPLEDQPDSWTECTPATAARFSAVAYFFARQIAQREKVAVGIIDTSWGGTPAESWVSLHAFGTNPALFPVWSSWANFADRQAELPATLAQEATEDSIARAAGQPLPVHAWHPFAPSWQPSGLYNGMIAPLAPFSIRGFLWYQGETNSSPDRAPYYQLLLTALIDDWRARFAQGLLPFLYAQISSFDSPAEDWGMLRDQQRRVLDVAGSAMAVTLDIGLASNVHPPDKQDVGARLALAARHLVYGESIVATGPVFRETTTECNLERCAMRVWFDEASGLNLDAPSLSGFELAAADHHFFSAKATVEGETVVVSSDKVQKPAFVRFAWNNVVQSFLYNRAHLPASTFTSENMPTP